MSAKPTLGYATRTEAVQAMRQQKMTTRQIAHRIGIDPNTVTALEYSAARTRKLRMTEATGRTVVIPVDALDTLYADAVKRGLTVNALVRRLIETIADEDMVDAVLDDRGER